ncbi:hypothetical protein LX69_03126 [Breznakibacter xylanolyticus]|uniref:Uncharacterized protein n=1 Tax=Breznakibacter xylanolyticus TaxID=990 RepID=A0A2W7PPU8_9BACT|nr:hypothetical protein [Breznakibacter xylanolyticus]MBN2744923.1 hypothetical protein [Marinilabiliaceae bacterium]PZX11399.1 hypothetical protein LX69_03126 [Breznakibacter xylanolyticus]
MNSEHIIERYGNLMKLESLISMDEKILPNTFVLEAPEPFPGFFGYYNEVPVDAKPLYVYFVLKHLYTLEEVTRAWLKIRTHFPAVNMHAAAGTVNIYNDLYHVLRIRHLDTYDQIAQLQELFIKEGFELAKKPSHKIEAQAIIRIKKFFILKEIDHGIYLDMTEKDHGYIVIPKLLSWKEFDDITHQVKNNWEKSNFDAAIGHFHNNFEITDMIRIYNPTLSLNYLQEIKAKYLARIK